MSKISVFGISISPRPQTSKSDRLDLLACNGGFRTQEKVSHPNSAKNEPLYSDAIKLGILDSAPEIPTLTFDTELGKNHYVIALLANITNGLFDITYHAVVIYEFEAGHYKIKDSQGNKYKISKNRCTSMQVKKEYKFKISKSYKPSGQKTNQKKYSRKIMFEIMELI